MSTKSRDLPTHADAIIIGSGMGALAAAICLTRAGKSVIILEQHTVPGGWCHSFRIAGHRFSPGCHYIGQLGAGQTTRALYEGLGVANELVFFEMNPAGFEHCWIGMHKMMSGPALTNGAMIFRHFFPMKKKEYVPI